MLISRWVLVAGIFAVAPVSAGDPPAQIWVHGVIYTGVRDSAAASALVIRGDRIEYVGDEATARAREPASAKTVDLRGATVIPGFVDAHQHLAGVGFRELDFNLEGTTGVADLRRRVRERMRTVKDRDWLSGGGWIETHWQPAQFPTRQALDDLTPHTPAFPWNALRRARDPGELGSAASRAHRPKDA
jgi:predicted amidohydrolase YtcJ